MHDRLGLPPNGMCHVAFLHFGEKTENISQTVQDKDIVETKD